MTREEAIDIIRKNIPLVGIGATEMTDALTELIPELRESENEKIRTLLVALVQWAKTFNQSGLDPNTANKMLSYLEDRKELTPADGWDYADKRMSHPLYLEGFEAGRAVEREVSEPAAEWSEVDREKVEQYLHDRDGGMLWSKATEITRDILDILRPSWKPSEEQMNALETTAHLSNFGCDIGRRNTLLSLCNDLKKL